MTKFMVNGELITPAGSSRDIECDYCGELGHTWHRHSEAHADVAAWKREQACEANR